MASERRRFGYQHQANQRWSFGFLSDALDDGRCCRVLNVVDDLSRECLARIVDTSLVGHSGRTRVGGAEGSVEEAPHDHQRNGTCLVSHAVLRFSETAWIELHYIAAGKRYQNAFFESFEGRLLNECLNEHAFPSLAEARRIIENWRIDYNTLGPHSSLGALAPSEFVRRPHQGQITAGPN